MALALTPAAGAPPGLGAADDALYRRIAFRLAPVLLACFFIAYLDRVNVGFAKLQMARALGFSDATYGLGAGLFFVGYAAFEVPSNLILHRVGARRWIARIMVTWGIVSFLFAFVTSAWQFYALRLLLGVAEAGFAPGALLYLTTWFPPAWRARTNTAMLVAIPLSGVIGGPVSGAIMGLMNHAGGWAGWRWLFAIEAVPALVAGLLVLRHLPDRPRDARFLSPAEAARVEADLAAAGAGRATHASVRAFLADRRLALLALIYFTVVMGQYAISFWLPTMLRGAGIAGPLAIGLLSAIPFLCAAATMVALARSADRRDERRWHLVVPMCVGAAAVALAPLLAHSVAASVACLSVAAAGLLAATPMFWSLPPLFLGGTAAAAGIGAINALGNVAGFVSPAVVGAVATATGGFGAAMRVVALVTLAGAALALAVPRNPKERDRT